MVVFNFDQCLNSQFGEFHFRQILINTEKFIKFTRATDLDEETCFTDLGKYVCEYLQMTDGITEGFISFNDPYKIQVGKTKMYSWEEILDQVGTKLNNPDLNSEE